MASAEDVLTNLNNNLEPAMGMLVGAAYIMGLVLVVRGILKFKKLAELHNQMASAADIGSAIMFVFIGALLIWSPGFFEASTYTIFGSDNSNLMSYDQVGNSSYSIWKKTLIHVMQIIGAIAFIRGWAIIAHSTDANSQPGQFTKGLTHVIGGLLCYHIIAFLDVLNQTLGNPFSLTF